MSKSLGNTVSADEYVEKFGSDVFRTYLAFGFSYTEGGPWSDDGILAINKFFQKIQRVFENFASLNKNDIVGNDEDLTTTLHKTIKAVTNDIDKFQFNTAVARLMELTTAITKYQTKQDRSYAEEKQAVEIYAKLLAPFAPHYMEEVWQEFGYTTSIFDDQWPEYDEQKTISKNIEIVVQINGSIKSRIVIPAGTEQQQMQEIAMQDEKIQALLEGKIVKKVIAIKDKLVNIVVIG